MDEKISLKNKINELQTLELFADLTFSDMEKIAPYFKKRKYKKGELIYSAQRPARHFIFVLTGEVIVYRLSDQGKRQIIRLIESDEFTGELALFEGVRKAYAEANIDVELYVIEYEKFLEKLETYPKLALKMIKILSYRLHLSEEQTAWMSTHTAVERLWLYLNKEAETIDGNRIYYYTQTKRFLASYLGMTSETLSRALHQLEAENKIKEIPNDRIELLIKQ